MSRLLRSTDNRGALRSRQRGFLLNPFRFSGGGGGNITVVGVTNGSASGSSGTSHSATRTGTTAGNTLLAIITWYGTPTLSSVTCSGETVSIIGSAAGNGSIVAGARSQYAVIEHLASGGSKTVTATVSASAPNITVNLIELSGTAAGSVIGAHPSATTNTSTNPSASITTTGSGSLVFGTLMKGSGGTTTPDGGYTNANFAIFYSYEYGSYLANVGSAGAKTVSWTAGNADWFIDPIEVLSS